MHCKKIVSCLAAAAIALAGAGALPAGTLDRLDITASAADIIASGECGMSCTYKLESNGTLTISGTGKMRDYLTVGSSDCVNEKAPWYQMRSSVNKIVVGSGITKIGNSTFYGLTEATEVIIPSSVTSIGSNAFSECEKLTTINIPAGVNTFGTSPFKKTKWLNDKRKSNPLVVVNNILIDGSTAKGKANIPNGVTTIIGAAFEGASELTEVVIPPSVTRIENQVFHGCAKLKTLTIPATVTYVGYKTFGFYWGDSGETAYTDVMLYCYTGSEAERYAMSYGVKYTRIDGGSPIVLYGDVNCNGRVDQADIALLQQYLADWEVSVDMKAADVTCDGKLEQDDVALLQQSLADWKVTLGK